MRKYERECIKLCENGGLTNLEISHRGKHLKIKSSHGMLVMPSTPGDRRWRYNLQRNIRSALRN